MSEAELTSVPRQSFGLPDGILDRICGVFAQHDRIESVSIYGSRAKGNFRAGSDIDLAIKSADLSFAELLKIEDQIDDLMLAYTVDLSLYQLIDNADLTAHIDRVGVEIYRRGADCSARKEGQISRGAGYTAAKAR